MLVVIQRGGAMQEREHGQASGVPAARLPRAVGDDSAAVVQAVAAARAGRGLTPEAVPLLQRAAGNSAVTSVLGDELDGSLVHSVIGNGGGGQPLDSGVQKVMESHLGADLSDVRVHTDARASESAQAIQAQAYTSGNHVVFQRQHYQPNTDSGLRMLAHELTHVVQQRNGPVDGRPVSGGVSVSDPSDRFERAAESSADAVVRSIGNAGGVGGLQRAEDEPS
jgi:hypothetical protein